jgi:predicted PhzF superfamily epimerase YddE/YHI9
MLSLDYMSDIHFAPPQVDAFADRPFAGNPAAVLQLPHWPGGGATIGTGDTHWLQLVASEFNLSETAFVVRRERGAGDPVSSASDAGSALAPEEVSDEFDLRWFTPAVEVCFSNSISSTGVRGC